MTAGIQGTGPYARLKDLRRKTQDIRYEIQWFCDTPRKLGAQQKALKSTQQEIKLLMAEIKAAKEKP